MWSCVLNEEAVVAATASADFSTRLWNALTGDEVHQFQHSHIARTVAFARRSPRLLSAGAAACPFLCHKYVLVCKVWSRVLCIESSHRCSMPHTKHRQANKTASQLFLKLTVWWCTALFNAREAHRRL